MSTTRLPDLSPVLSRYPTLIDDAGRPCPALCAAELPITPIDVGLINQTFALGDAHILQKLHPAFAPTVNLDIAALTSALSARGIPVPRLVPADDDTLWVSLGGDDASLAGHWRIMTRLPGETHRRVATLAQAEAAGEMLGRFHSALREVSHTFAFTRPGAHDTPAHMARVRQALQERPDHRLAQQVTTHAETLLTQWTSWGALPSLPRRLCHGDPKISNFLFNAAGDAVIGVVDLDTMAWMSIDIDLGDAMRSWCNAATEDDPTPVFSAERFEAILRGYMRPTRAWLTEPEVDAIAPAAQRICLELSARYTADALYENYFGWDPQVAPTRGEHNLLRARGQLCLAISAGEQLDVLRHITRTLHAQA